MKESKQIGVPWNTEIPSTSSTPVSSSECHSLPFSASFFTADIRISWVEPLIFVAFYLACGLSITAGYHRLFSHRTTKRRGQCVCSMLCSVQQPSRIQPSNGAVTTDVITSRPTKKKILTRSRKDSCGHTWAGSWSIRARKSLNTLKTYS